MTLCGFVLNYTIVIELCDTVLCAHANILCAFISVYVHSFMTEGKPK